MELIQKTIRYNQEGKKTFDQFYILPGELEGNEKVLKQILKEGPRRLPFLTGPEAGVCFSGFLKNRSEI